MFEIYSKITQHVEGKGKERVSGEMKQIGHVLADVEAGGRVCSGS